MLLLPPLPLPLFTSPPPPPPLLLLLLLLLNNAAHAGGSRRRRGNLHSIARAVGKGGASVT